MLIDLRTDRGYSYSDPGKERQMHVSQIRAAVDDPVDVHPRYEPRSGEGGGPVIGVLIAEEHPIFRDGLTRGIDQRPTQRVVGAVSNGAEALAECRRLRPDVLVLDLELSGIDGLTVIRSLAAEELPTKVLVISGTVQRSLVYEAVSAGARGYLPKQSDVDRVCEAIEEVAEGRMAWLDEVQEALADEIRGRGNSGEAVLTARELEILKLIADGRKTSEVAAELYLSVATVKTHLHRSFTKLGVNDRAAAVAEAMRRGLFG
jgi:two-component system nitrate/nitrite response regulator NarL